MAEEFLVKNSLTSSMLEAGKELTRRLDRVGFKAVASFWLYNLETNEWRLVLASHQVDRKGPKKAYSTILNALSKKPSEEVIGLSLQNITLTSPLDPLIKSLRTALRTGKALSDIRFSRNRINDLFIEDAYIYRVL
jgi:hypothetical protein